MPFPRSLFTHSEPHQYAPSPAKAFLQAQAAASPGPPSRPQPRPHSGPPSGRGGAGTGGGSGGRRRGRARRAELPAAMVQEPGPRLVAELLLRAGAAGGILCLCSRAFVE